MDRDLHSHPQHPHQKWNQTNSTECSLNCEEKRNKRGETWMQCKKWNDFVYFSASSRLWSFPCVWSQVNEAHSSWIGSPISGTNIHVGSKTWTTHIDSWNQVPVTSSEIREFWTENTLAASFSPIKIWTANDLDTFQRTKCLWAKWKNRWLGIQDWELAHKFIHLGLLVDTRSTH